MIAVTAIITAIALSLFIAGFFTHKPETPLWMVDTILWLVWAYLAYNLAADAFDATNNSYVPVALAMTGAGFTLVCIYMDVVVILETLKAHTQPKLSSDEQYELDKQQNRQRIYDLTRTKP